MVDNSKLISSKFANDLLTLSYQINTNNLIGRGLHSEYKLMSDNEEERDKRTKVNVKHHDDFRKKKGKHYDTYLRNIFLKLEKRSTSATKNRISADEIPRSSTKPTVIKLIHSNVKHKKMILQIAALEYNSTVLSQFFVDGHNRDFFSVPLNEVINKQTDRTIIMHASNIKLPESEQQNGKVYMYEFAWATHLEDQENRQIASAFCTCVC